MQFFICSVMLAGDRNHIVMNKGPVSVAEIAVLRAIHGQEAVYGFRAHHVDAGCDHAELREQLTQRYQGALPGGNEPVVESLFGRLGPLPTTLAHIGLDTKAEAARLREQAAAAAKAAEAMEAQEAPEDAAGMDAFFAEEPKPARASRGHKAT